MDLALTNIQCLICYKTNPKHIIYIYICVCVCLCVWLGGSLSIKNV